jgi:hypothetical protein
MRERQGLCEYLEVKRNTGFADPFSPKGRLSCAILPVEACQLDDTFAGLWKIKISNRNFRRIRVV